MTDRRYVVRRTSRVGNTSYHRFAERAIGTATAPAFVQWGPLKNATLVNAAQAAVLVATFEGALNESTDACEVADPERWPFRARLLITPE